MKITATQRFLDPVIPDEGRPYTLEYTEGESYDVPPARGHYFISNGWATTELGDVELSEPWNTNEATEEDAERIEREIHAPARERTVVETLDENGNVLHRRRGFGEPEYVNGPPELGKDGHARTLDVQSATSGAGTRF